LFERAATLARAVADEAYRKKMETFETFVGNVEAAKSEWYKASRAFVLACGEESGLNYNATEHALKYWDRRYSFAKYTLAHFLKMSTEERNCELGS